MSNIYHINCPECKASILVTRNKEEVGRASGKLCTACARKEALKAATLTSDNEDERAEIDATDAARKLAEELGVVLAEVVGTGSNGRITVEDVRDYAP